MPATLSVSAITRTEPMRRVLSCWEIWAKLVPAVTVNTKAAFLRQDIGNEHAFPFPDTTLSRFQHYSATKGCRP